jgi:hypothetical protein
VSIKRVLIDAELTESPRPPAQQKLAVWKFRSGLAVCLRKNRVEHPFNVKSESRNIQGAESRALI